MLLLERLLHADAETAVAQVTVPRDGLFLQDEGMPAWVGLEYMAQTVAAWAGWQAVQAGQPVKLGFLLGTRKFDAQCAFFALGAVLHIHVRSELVGDNGLGMFDCQIQDASAAVLAIMAASAAWRLTTSLIATLLATSAGSADWLDSTAASAA